ncbi:hypothetical protein [Urechidicola vernalis]|uniref:Cardiolipin synthase N-terminal domain-containing protein n=1 Tax=Urechidicola vernalis TaxID=3075600 RepID=A0ABU2Y3N6_9FLAO|nr:hypothetical protein [Urechidicola sp. P050]MDT0552818.1 hypothetical protein [Urechidicola sp. P050]
MENLSHQEKVMSFKEWALTIFIASLPLIGLIMVLVWAFDSNTNIHKKNWAKGNLLIMVLGFVLVFFFLFVFGGMALLAGLANN